MKTLALEEVANYYKETGQKFPKRLQRGMADKDKLEKTYALAEAHLDYLPGLLAYCEPGDLTEAQLLKAKLELERFLEGVAAISEMPKQAPKHRDLLLEKFFTAQDIVLEVKAQIDTFGRITKSPLESYPQAKDTPF
jgi:hypothetical protein